MGYIANKFKKLDLFRKTPTDLTEGSVFGAILSIFCVAFVLLLSGLEFYHYMTPELKTDYRIEQYENDHIKISFDITLTQLSCDIASLDVVNQLGTHQINVTQNIRRWQVYENGYQKEITPVTIHEEFGTMDNIKNEQYSTKITDHDHYLSFIQSKWVVLVDFFAPWCHWCRALAPIYEALAQEIRQSSLSSYVAIGKVDCTNPKTQYICIGNHIKAYPTIIAFTPRLDVKFQHYHGDRTVEAFKTFINQLIEQIQQLENRNYILAGNNTTIRNIPLKREAGDNKEIVVTPEGCRMAGDLIVPRMAGNFHISCHNSTDYIIPSAINVNHIVHSLTFGDSNLIDVKTPEYLTQGINTLQNKTFETSQINATIQHILKVIPTKYQPYNKNSKLFYQYTVDSGIVVSNEEMPEAIFSFDFNPISLYIYTSYIPFYHFITSLFAIVGGFVTMIMFIDNLIFTSMDNLQTKIDVGKFE